jgi:hypothetical protein
MVVLLKLFLSDESENEIQNHRQGKGYGDDGDTGLGIVGILYL